MITTTSPTQLATANHDEYGGCLRRWHFRYIAKRPEPQFKAAEVGTEGHKQIESYLRTGEKVLNTHALGAIRHIPDPGQDLLIEHSIHEDSPIHVQGLLVRGYLDLLNPRGVTVRDDGEVIQDPPGTVEVLDWKFTGSEARLKNATNKTATDATPMVCYGEWAARKFDAEYVRLSHLYILFKGRPQVRKVGALVDRWDLTKRWVKVESIASTMIDASTEEDSNKVPANTRSCHAYGNPCPHRSYCTAGREKTLDEIFGPAGASSLLDALNGPSTEEKTVSLLDKLKISAPEVEVKIKELEKQEADVKAKRVASLPPGFAESIAVIESSGCGFPALGGAAAQCYATLRGIDPPAHGGGYAGSSGQGAYNLGKLTINTALELKQLADELKGAGFVKAEATPVKAPDGPELLPADVPESKPTVTEVESPEVKVEREYDPPEPFRKTKRGRPKKVAEPIVEVKPVEETPALEEMTPVPVISEPAPSPEEVADVVHHAKNYVDAFCRVSIYVDALPPLGTSFTYLDDYVDRLCDALTQQYGLGAVEIRCAPKDSILAFGGWRGALAALSKKQPPTPGVYIARSGDERVKIVCEALRDMVAATGIK